MCSCADVGRGVGGDDGGGKETAVGTSTALTWFAVSQPCQRGPVAACSGGKGTPGPVASSGAGDLWRQM